MPIPNSSYRTRLRGNLSNLYLRPFQRPSPCSFRCTSPVKPAVHYTQSLPYPPPHFRDGKNPPKRMPLRQNRGKRGVHGEKPAKRMPSRAFPLKIIRAERNLPRFSGKAYVSDESRHEGGRFADISKKGIRFGRFLPLSKRCRRKDAAQITLGGILHTASQLRIFLKRYFTWSAISPRACRTGLSGQCSCSR